MHESYWQPAPANGYVDILVSPESAPDCPYVMGTQTLPPGSYVREHTHAAQFESIFVLEGQGSAYLDEEKQLMQPGAIFAIRPGTSHRFVNDGSCDLKFQWTISPGGLEKFFRAIGRPRQVHETAPPSFERPGDPELDGRHQMKA